MGIPFGKTPPEGSWAIFIGDDEGLSESIKKHLESKGIRTQCFTAHSAAGNAIKRCLLSREDEPPSFIICSVSGEGGFGASAFLKHQGNNTIPIIGIVENKHEEEMFFKHPYTNATIDKAELKDVVTGDADAATISQWDSLINRIMETQAMKFGYSR